MATRTRQAQADQQVAAVRDHGGDGPFGGDVFGDGQSGEHGVLT
ncbi:hypothetical protein ACFXKG_22515 [Streptomyces sp. NPDC059255]